MSVELNYKVFGEGEPVIILHGLFGMLDNWQTFAKLLAENYMVYIVDQRDHGKSPHTEEFSYHLLANDLHEFMTSQWIYEARLIGHSMGGKTVMQFADEYPDMVEQMVVVDIAPVKYKAGHNDVFDALFAIDIDKLSDRKQAESILAQYISEDGVRQFLMKNLQRRKEGGYRWKMNLELLYKEYQNILSGIGPSKNDVDALFISGGLSDYIDDNAKEAINAKYSHVNTVTIADAGHWVHAQKPRELLEIVNTYFNKEKA